MDPFFFTPRQLATHLLLTYPADYKVSPTRLKNSIIIGNDISGKVFLSAIPRSNDLGVMLGVGTLGARLWLWDKIIEMRKMSEGYSVWRTGEHRERMSQGSSVRRLAIANSFSALRARSQDDIDQSFRNFMSNYTPSNSPSEIPARRLGKRDGSYLPSLRSATSVGWDGGSYVPSRSATPVEWSSSSSSSYLSNTSPSIIGSHSNEATEFSRDPSSEYSPSLFISDQETTPQPGPKRSTGKQKLGQKTPRMRCLRPRRYLQLPRSKLADIIDPDDLNRSEVIAMLRVIQKITERDIYEEFVRAAKVTARERGLPPSLLAMKVDRETVLIVREMAAVYSSWILSRSYPLESLNLEDVVKIANFDLFLQFKVQFLNFLIPYDTRGRGI